MLPNQHALTDHTSRDNHAISWPATTILDRELDKTTRLIKETVHIWKQEGTTILELGTMSLQELEEELNKLLLVKVSGRDRNVKVKMSGCVEVIVFFL